MKKFNTKIKLYPSNYVKVTYSNCDIFSYPKKEVIMEDFEELLKFHSNNIYELNKYLNNSNFFSFPNKDINNLSIQEVYDNLNCFKILDNLSSKSANLKKSKREVKHLLKDVNRSIRRAKERIFDIVYLNDWKYFVTLTLDPQKCNSFDEKICAKKLRNWLNYHQKVRGLKYILIPERHKSGRIHFHLLINDCGFTMVDSGHRTKRDNKVIYNLPDWRLGWTTAIPFTYDNDNSNLAISKYITKYITKDINMIFGKYYWSSRDLVREPDIVLVNVDFTKLDSFQLVQDDLKKILKYKNAYHVPNTPIYLSYQNTFVDSLEDFMFSMPLIC